MTSARATAIARPPHISTAPPPLASMDFARLLDAGISACQELGGMQWTDFNQHDPGVTILEQLCYAITDFGYRASYPVADILASLPSNSRAGNSTLFTGDKILSSNPISANDFRKILLDQAQAQGIANLKNLWLEAAPGEQSLYQLKLEAYTQSDNSTLAAQLGKLCSNLSNLGEDLVAAGASVLTPCDIGFGGVIELAPDAPAEQTMAEVLYQLQNALVPFIVYRTVSQQLEAGVPPEHIYDGPLLKQGTIDDSLLRARVTSVGASDLGGAILGVAGVQAVSKLVLAGAGADGRVAVGDDQVVRLAPSIFVPQIGFGAITVQCQGKTLRIDWAEVSTLVGKRLAGLQAQAAYTGNNQAQVDYLTVPAGSNRSIAHYYSIQRQFPQNYGIGATGLAQPQPQSAGDVRQITARDAQTRQLKAYLLLFEQLLADCGAQLENAGSLLALDPAPGRSYFWQSLAGAGEGPPHIHALLRGPVPGPEPAPAPDGLLCSIHVREAQPDGRLLLRSPEYAGLAAARAGQAALFALGLQAAAYRTHALPDGSCQLLLEADDGQLAAFGCVRYASVQQAQDAIAPLAALIDGIAGDVHLREQCVSITSRGTRGAQLNDMAGQGVLSATQLSAAQQAAWPQWLLRYGINAANYRIVAEGGAWRWYLYQQQTPLASGMAPCASEAQAHGAIVAAVALLQSLCCDSAALQRQLVLSPPPGDAAPVPDAASGEADPRVRAYERGLDQLVARHDPHAARRNAFLDHLLARFGEHFDDVALRQTDPQRGLLQHVADSALIRGKCDYLRQYVPGQRDLLSGHNGLGSARSQGMSLVQDPAHDSVPLPPTMHSRVRMLLGMPPESPLPPGFIAGLPGTPVAVPWSGAYYLFKSDSPMLFQLLCGNAGALTKTGLGRLQSGHVYTLEKVPAVARADAVAGAATQADLAALSQALGHIGAHPAGLRQGERMVLVEHGRLRPAPGSDAPAPDGDGFYDYRISVIFARQPLRAQNTEFQLLAERVVFENCPAHIDARCYWLPHDAMRQFATRYEAWFDALAPASSSTIPQTPPAVPPAHGLAVCAAALEAFLRQLEADI